MAAMMHRRHLLTGFGGCAIWPFPALAEDFDAASNVADAGWLIDQITARYAYLPDRHMDLTKLREIYVGEAGAVAGGRAFLHLLERLLAELHDHHVEANANDDDSPQLVPTGADVWAFVRDGRAMVEEVRAGGFAANAGVRAGDEILSIEGAPVLDAIAAHAPRALSGPDPEAGGYTLRVLLAGDHKHQRVITVRIASGAERAVTLPPNRHDPDGPPLTVRSFDGDVAAIRVENSLGDSRLVSAFDAALESARGARGLIIDLRNTPSGGDTDVAEPILGRFIVARQGYQRIFDPAPGKTVANDSTVRMVDPRGPVVKVPLVVLVDRWTGSMGEGMAIGLDAMRRATVVGRRMAGLCGATERFMLPRCGIGVSIPTVRLYHLDGTPREKWVPPVFVDLVGSRVDDPILARGLAILHGAATARQRVAGHLAPD